MIHVHISGVSFVAKYIIIVSFLATRLVVMLLKSALTSPINFQLYMTIDHGVQKLVPQWMHYLFIVFIFKQYFN